MTDVDVTSFEVDEPILSSPFEEPPEHWQIEEGKLPKRQPGRRPAGYFYRDPSKPPSDDGISRGEWVELDLINLVRGRLAEWRASDYAGATRTTRELIEFWRRDGKHWPPFFAQLEAVESILFLREARSDLLQGIDVPREEGGDFLRYACKMATGSGKTMVMGMVAAWSILNKVASKGDARFSDVVLVICPNVTIRNRLRELDPNGAEASIYRARDLVPSHLMPSLRQGRVLVKNWHEFELKGMQAGAKVQKRGKPETFRVTIKISEKTTTGRGGRYLTEQALDLAMAQGTMRVVEDRRPGKPEVVVEETRYVESDASGYSAFLAAMSVRNRTSWCSTMRRTMRTGFGKPGRICSKSGRRWTKRQSKSLLRRRPSGSTDSIASNGFGESTSVSTCRPRRITWRVPGLRRTGSSLGLSVSSA